MPSPFPGMDPYLEAPDLWSDFHDALAAELRAELNVRLPEPYYARLQMRPELGVVLEAGIPHRIVPDVVVVRPPATPPTVSVAVVEQARTVLSEPVRLTVRTDPLQHRFVEIRDASRGHKLVTLIEIASPSNKRPGPDRRAYEEKQREVLDSDANLIELDLLRGGQRLLPYPDLQVVVESLACDYLVLINRAATRLGTTMDYELYPVRLREPLPCIPVPLREPDPDLPLDLQIVVNRAYDSGPYRRAVDYHQVPEPPLPEPDAAWANALLQEKELRE